jgi:peptidoglycan/xylan/chitin deacetylase (PgdA/CDA1 family)
VKATLTYHSIDASQSPISVSSDSFALHLRWLAGGRVRALSLTDLVSHATGQDDAVAVTFDDGFANIREPVERLLDAGVPVTIFVVTGEVGRTNAWGGRPSSGIPTLPLLGWDDLERLVARGATIGAHSRRHPILRGLPDAALQDELIGSREDLRQRLGVVADHFAYPYGEFDDTVAAATARAYRFAHTTDLRPIGADEHPMRLPRLDMYYFRDPGAIEAWGTAGFARRLTWRRIGRAIRARVMQRRAPAGREGLPKP